MTSHCIYYSSNQNHVGRYETYIHDHQQYHNAYTECSEWLAVMQEKLALCSDVTGDRFTVENRMERLQVR